MFIISRYNNDKYARERKFPPCSGKEWYYTMKMRIVCYSKKKKREAFCEAIAKAQEASWDKLPLAYSFNNERLVVFVASLPHEDLRRMVPEMTKIRSQNVAFLIDGTPEAAKEYLQAAKDAGTNVIENVKYVKCAKLSFLDKVTPAELEDAANWINEVTKSLK